MVKFKKNSTNLEGVYVIEPTVFGDDRGFFLESYNKREFHEIGIFTEFIQDNHSKSTKGVLRGLHFQIIKPQAKLVRVTKGKLFDVVVDLRRNSPTYKNYFSIELTEGNKKMLYVPEGFAHGFLTLSEEAELMYKVNNYYFPEYDKGIIFNDSSLKIKWPFDEYGIENPILSEKDKNLEQIQSFERTSELTNYDLFE